MQHSHPTRYALWTDAPDGILHTAYTPERLAAWCREQGIAADEITNWIGPRFGEALHPFSPATCSSDEAIDIVLRPATRAWIREQIRIEFD
jgi:hypothetical protein